MKVQTKFFLLCLLHFKLSFAISSSNNILDFFWSCYYNKADYIQKPLNYYIETLLT